MATTKYKNILSVLEQYYNELKSYSDILKHLAESKTITGHETRDRDKLRESLVRKTGVLKERIIEVTGKQYYEQFMNTYDMWSEAFNPASFLPTPSNRTALAFCINATNEAIGKLESDIRLGIRDKQGNLIEKLQKLSSEPPKAFIAHGGDSPALSKLKSFLEALGVQPLVVEEQPSEGRSVGENVDWYARQADCAIILAARGDIDGKTGRFIPRGNVLIEIGKSQELFKDRIVYLLQAGTKFPTNISEKVWGRFTTQRMDDAFIKIARELKKFGILKAVKPKRRGVYV